mmetsp:Transcript_19241/g.72668  ORF Transcript_19241/g.72668 Transcript_19241/m.72668 type:complete len:209 (+) Transcript_19241:1802-2428(+)
MRPRTLCQRRVATRNAEGVLRWTIPRRRRSRSVHSPRSRYACEACGRRKALQRKRSIDASNSGTSSGASGDLLLDQAAPSCCSRHGAPRWPSRRTIRPRPRCPCSSCSTAAEKVPPMRFWIRRAASTSRSTNWLRKVKRLLQLSRTCLIRTTRVAGRWEKGPSRWINSTASTPVTQSRARLRDQVRGGLRCSCRDPAASLSRRRPRVT